MKLYITDRELPPLCGIVIKPQFMGLKVTHLTLASQTWDTLFIDVDESIQEGSLRFLHKKCSVLASVAQNTLPCISYICWLSSTRSWMVSSEKHF